MLKFQFPPPKMFLRSTFKCTLARCYDTTGSSGDKSLGGALATLGDDTKLYGLSVRLVRSVQQL